MSRMVQVDETGLQVDTIVFQVDEMKIQVDRIGLQVVPNVKSDKFKVKLMEKSRMKMTCKLEDQPFTSKYQLKRIDKDDILKVATTMLEAYKGTVDQQEETIQEAVLEVEKIINDGYGPFIKEASYWIELNNEAVAVICINIWNGRPLITEIFTGINYRRNGFASELIKASMDVLNQLGYKEIDLNVTKENLKAVHLYEELGFVQN